MIDSQASGGLTSSGIDGSGSGLAGSVDDSDRWISLHVFYAANSNPVLVHCIGPLVAELRERSLLSKWFFIRYWLEGPHTRIRLLPAAGADVDEVRLIAQGAITAYLKKRPALYEEDRDSSDDLYRNMYLAEYSQEQWDAEYGPDGKIPSATTTAWPRSPMSGSTAGTAV